MGDDTGGKHMEAWHVLASLLPFPDRRLVSVWTRFSPIIVIVFPTLPSPSNHSTSRRPLASRRRIMSTHERPSPPTSLSIRPTAWWRHARPRC